MLRSWITALIIATGLPAQTPPPAPAPQPTPAAQPTPATQPAPAAQPVPAPQSGPFGGLPLAQWRPTQRMYAYTLERAALAAHELGYYRSHPRAVEVRDALEALVALKGILPDPDQPKLSPVEAYLGELYADHGLYDASGVKLVMGGSWKELRTLALAATRAARRTGQAAAARGLEPRLARLRGLLFNPRVDATAPIWAEPEAPARGRKARRPRGPRIPDGFAAQKAVTLWWVRQALHYVPDTPQEVEVQGVKAQRLLPDPAQAKPLADLAAWLDRDDRVVLADPAFGWLDVRRLAALPDTDQGRLGFGLLAEAGTIAASQAPQGAPGPLPLVPLLQPVLGPNPFGSSADQREILVDATLQPAPTSLAAQMVAFEQLGRTRQFDVK